MHYIDGFVTAVPADKRQDYLDHIRLVAPLFRENGALRMVEGWGDDVPDGKITDFRRAVQAETDEIVLFSWIEWPSKEVRDAGMARVMSDPQLAALPLPFDGKRMIYGGFRPIFDE
jgi:uncharacterized protein YbaA (DUF1428 family)